MRLIKIPVLSMTVVVGLAVLFTLLGLFGKVSPAQARGEGATETTTLAAPLQAPAYDIRLSISFTDPAFVAGVWDLDGNRVGEGTHVGKVKCVREHCSKRTVLRLNGALYEYRFKRAQVLDPVEDRAVVSGAGTITVGGKKERFSFTATFQNNGDGTVSSQYVASRGDASFDIPTTPAGLVIASR